MSSKVKKTVAHDKKSVGKCWQSSEIEVRKCISIEKRMGHVSDVGTGEQD